MSDMIPLIASAADLPDAIRYAQTRPTARWYVAKQAVALNAADLIPADWRMPLTAASQPDDLSQGARDEAADAGEALPDGSFPIRDTEELDKAVQALGRAKDPDRAKRHIIKRARALGALDKLPEAWGITASAAELIAEDSDAAVELETLVAASARGEGEHLAGDLSAAWDETLHPRGRDGKWITRGGKIDIYNLDNSHRPALQATAEGVHSDPKMGMVITARVTTPGSYQGTEHRVGDAIQVLPKNIEEAPEARAHLTGIDPSQGRYQATSVGNEHMVVDTHNDGPDPGVVSRHATPEAAQAHAANLNTPPDDFSNAHATRQRLMKQARDTGQDVKGEGPIWSHTTFTPEGTEVSNRQDGNTRVDSGGYGGEPPHQSRLATPDEVARHEALHGPTDRGDLKRQGRENQAEFVRQTLTPNADRLNSDEAHPDDQLGTPPAAAPEHTAANNFGFPAQHKVTPVTHADGRAQLHVEDTTQDDPRFASTARAYDVGSPDLDQARQQANHDYASDAPARMSVHFVGRSGMAQDEEWRKNKKGTYDRYENGRKTGFSNFTRSQVEARGEHTPLDAKGNPIEQAAPADDPTEHQTQLGLPGDPRTPEEHQQHAAYHQGEADRAAREANDVADPATASRFEATERHHRTMQHEHEEAARQASTSAPANAGGDTASSLLAESEDPDTFLADRGGSDQVDNAGMLSGVATEFEQAADHPDTTPEQRAQLADRLAEIADRDAESHSYFDGEALGLSDEETTQAEQEQQQAQAEAARVIAKLRGGGTGDPPSKPLSPSPSSPGSGNPATDLLGESADPDTFLADRGGSDQIDNADMISGVASEFERAGDHPDTTPEQRTQLADRLEELAGREAESFSHFDPDTLGVSDSDASEAERAQQQAQQRAEQVVAKLRGGDGGGDMPELPDGPLANDPLRTESTWQPGDPTPADDRAYATAMLSMADGYQQAEVEDGAQDDRLDAISTHLIQTLKTGDDKAAGDVADELASYIDREYGVDDGDLPKRPNSGGDGGSPTTPPAPADSTDPTGARYQAAHQAVKDAEARGDHLSDDPRDVAAHNRLLAIREKAFEQTPAGRKQAVDQAAAQQAKYERDLPANLDASRRANAAQADRRAEHQATDAATAPDDRIARMSEPGLKMIAGTKSAHADAARAELDRRTGGSQPGGSKPKFGEPGYRSPFQDGVDNGTFKPTGREGRGGGIHGPAAAAHMQSLRDRAKPRYQTREGRGPNGEVQHHVIDTQTGHGIVRTFKGKPNAAKHANDLNRAEADNSPENLAARASHPVGSKVRNEDGITGTVDGHSGGMVNWTADEMRGPDGKRTSYTSGPGQRSRPSRLEVTDKAVDAPPASSTTEPRKAALRAKVSEAQQQRLRDQGQANWNGHVQRTERAETARRKAKGLDENGNATRPISTSIASNQLRVAGHKSAGGEGGGQGFRVQRAGDGVAVELRGDNAKARQSDIVKHFTDLGYDAQPTKDGGVMLNNRRVAKTPDREPPVPSAAAPSAPTPQQPPADAGKPTHIPGVTTHGAMTDPIGVEVRKDGQRIGRLQDHRNATVRVMGHGSSANQRVGSKKDPHYTATSVHRGGWDKSPIRDRGRSVKDALDRLHSIHEQQTQRKVNMPSPLNTGAPSAAVDDLTDSQRVNRLVTMHGSDRSTWSVTNLRLAAKAGDQQAKGELAQREQGTAPGRVSRETRRAGYQDRAEQQGRERRRPKA